MKDEYEIEREYIETLRAMYGLGYDENELIEMHNDYLLSLAENGYEENKEQSFRGEFYTKIVGVTFEGRQRLISKLDIGEQLILLRNPNNPYDRNAIGVYNINYDMLGHINRDLAKKMAPLIDSGVRFQVTVSEVVGGGEYNYGVKILIQYLSNKEEQQLNINNIEEFKKWFYQGSNYYYSFSACFKQSLHVAVLEEIFRSLQLPDRVMGDIEYMFDNTIKGICLACEGLLEYINNPHQFDIYYEFRDIIEQLFRENGFVGIISATVGCLFACYYFGLSNIVDGLKEQSIEASFTNSHKRIMQEQWGYMIPIIRKYY